ncbi:cell division protein FtsA [bacterium]|nr:cell division protein FtsA [bacterium]
MLNQIITALDIGTSKIFGITCVAKETGLEAIAANVMNFSEDIVQRGRVTDIEEVSNSIHTVLRSLKNDSGENIIKVNIGLGGGHLTGISYPKSITIEPQGRTISESDIEKVKREIANSVSASYGADRQILFTTPQEYIIDDTNQTKKPPVGMHGNSLLLKMHVVTAETNPMKDIETCVKKAGGLVEGFYPHSWAAAESCLTEEEKKLGCILIDIGKSTTDLIMFSNNSVLTTDSVGIGSKNIDWDISHILHTSELNAEELKKKYGWANYPNLVQEKSPILERQVDIVDLTGKLSRSVSTNEISHIVYARASEILTDYVKTKVDQYLLKHSCIAGIVLTGGGARLQGFEHLAMSVFGLPARIGIPTGPFNLDSNYQAPNFASAIGTVMLASKSIRNLEDSEWWQKILKTVVHSVQKTKTKSNEFLGRIRNGKTNN